MSGSLILLDRDGVLNRMVVDAEHGTVDSPLHPSQVELVPGAAAALGALTQAGFGIAVVTNQPAWAKGKTTRENLEAVHHEVVRAASAQGGRVLSSHICFHRAEDGCSCRKPAPGLLQEAFRAHPDYDIKDSWMVGDSITDVQAGKRAGTRTALLGSVHCSTCRILEHNGAAPDHWAADLEDFARQLVDLPREQQAAVDPARMRVKIFADGADLESIRERATDPLVRGFTTNPTLMRKAGIEQYQAFARAVLAEVPDRHVSLEVIADEVAEIERQAMLISGWGENAYVKVPVTNTRGEPLAELIGSLSHRGVKVNVTAVFTLQQVQQVTDALRGGAPSVVSVFAGRIADAGLDPVGHMRSAARICQAAGPNIELLWASPREILNLVQAEQAGADIITMTDALLARLPSLGKPLDVFSLETVRMFKRDADAAGYRF